MMNMVTPTSTGGPESRYNHESVSVIPTGDNSWPASFSASVPTTMSRPRERPLITVPGRIRLPANPSDVPFFSPCTREVVAHQDLSII
jgi:hypothetical protein